MSVKVVKQTRVKQTATSAFYTLHLKIGKCIRRWESSIAPLDQEVGDVDGSEGDGISSTAIGFLTTLNLLTFIVVNKFVQEIKEMYMLIAIIENYVVMKFP